MENKIRFNIGDEVWHISNSTPIKKYISSYVYMQDRDYCVICENYVNGKVQYSKCYVSSLLTKDEYKALPEKEKIYKIRHYSCFSEDGHSSYYNLYCKYYDDWSWVVAESTIDDLKDIVNRLIKEDKK